MLALQEILPAPPNYNRDNFKTVEEQTMGIEIQTIGIGLEPKIPRRWG